MHSLGLVDGGHTVHSPQSDHQGNKIYKMHGEIRWRMEPDGLRYSALEAP